MHILNALFQCTKATFGSLHNVGSVCSRGRRRQSEEASRLLDASTTSNGRRVSQSQQSLTSDYTDYSRSKEAMLLFSCHAVAYYSFAVIGFSFLVDNHSVINSLYMASVTFTTIGYGDLTPTTTGARLYLIFLATYGVAILGIFLGVLGDVIIESQSALSTERRRELQRLVLGTIGSTQGHRGMHIYSSFKPSVSLSQDIASIVLLESPIVLVVMVLGALVGYYEGWGIIDSIYWMVVSSYTIGFGDIVPKSKAARLFCVLFLPFCVAVVGEVLGRIASVYIDRKRNRAEEAFLQRTLTLRDLRTLDLNQDGVVTKVEFLSYMLVSLQKVTENDIEELLAVFDRLDRDKSGTLTPLDLAICEDV